MPVTELRPAFVSPFDPRRRASQRRPSREPLARIEAEAPAAPDAPDPGLFAPLFRPDLSQIPAAFEPSSASESAPAVDFDDALDQLVSAARDGDLGRARAAFEALETEMLVARSAGRHEAPQPRANEPAIVALDRLAPLAISPHAADDVYETLAHYLDADGLTS